MSIVRLLIQPFRSVREDVATDQQIEQARAEVRQSSQAMQSSTRVILNTMSGMLKITREASSGKAL